MIPASQLGLEGGPPRYGALPPLDPRDLPAPGVFRDLDVDGLSVRTLDTGGDGPALVLVHGLSAYLAFWHLQVAHFAARGWRVLALDLPGFGASDKPDAPCSPPWYARVLGRWLDALGVPRAVLVGHSMGGQICMRFALDHPERVRALILSAPAGIEGFSPEAGAQMKAYWTEARSGSVGEPELRANFTLLAFNRADAEVEARLEERVRLQKHPSYAATSRAVSRCVAGMLDHPVRGALGGLICPTLVVFGGEDRMIPNPHFTGGTTAAIAAEARRLIPHARLSLLEGAGHYVHHDDPEGFHAAADAFLDEL
ncbi:MAG: alpha/beta fold hydrolase [Alphaproteobacteria bacterium]|nr:alpha/beta fold hydrolase [Alphaproteobacteria bacterium]